MTYASLKRRRRCLHCEEMDSRRTDSFYKWASFWTGVIVVFFIIATVSAQWRMHK